MKWWLITKFLNSSKKELYIVAVVLIFLLAMPVFAFSSLTNLPALAQGVVQLYTGPHPEGNLYEYGYCTFWAAKRRAEIGLPIPSTWGDAHTWDDGARRDKYLVDHIPAVGAIMEIDSLPIGHVAFVEKVNPDGSWEVSEMNVKGWDILSSRTFSAAAAQGYNFIH
jgi:surface antigen